MRVFISGGTRGIGRAILDRLLPQCDQVAVLARDPEHLNNLVAELSDDPIRVTPVNADLADLDAVQDALASLLPGWDRTDLLVLSAGMFTEGDLSSMPMSTFEHDLRVNMTANLLIIQSLLPSLRKAQAPRVVIIGSTAAYEAYPLVPSYGVAKWGLRSMAINLRSELHAEGIGVTFLSPGGTLTDMWEGEDIAEDRLLEPSDIAILVEAMTKLSPQAVVEDLVVRPILGDIHE